MHLLECIALKPGLIDKKTIRFDDRVTIIYGKNESGKSMIAKAIIDTLWGEFSGSFSLNGNIWDDLYFEILFKNSSNRYRFVKDRKESFLINYRDAKEDPDIKEVEILQRIYTPGSPHADSALCIKLYEETNDSETTRLFNKIDIDIFMNISYLAEPIEIARNGQLKYNAIQRFLLYDSSNFYSLYENISDAFYNIKNNSNNSILNEIIKTESELNNINKQFEIFDISNSKFDRLNKEKIRLEAELDNFNNELANLRKDKAKLLNIQKNVIGLDEINKRIEANNKDKGIEQQKIDSLLIMEKDLKHQYPQFFNFEESNIQNLKRIQEAYREVRDVHEEIENFYLLNRDKKNKLKNLILSINLFSVIILAALFGINYAYPIPILNEYKIRFIIGLLTLSIASTLLFLFYNLLNSRSKELRLIMKKKYKVEKKLEATLRKNSITLNEYKLEAIYEYLVKYFEEYGEYSISQSELLQMKEALKGEDYIRAIDDELQMLDMKKDTLKDEIDKDLKSLNDSSIINIDINKIHKLINEKNRRILNLKESIRHTCNILSQIDNDNKKSDQDDKIKKLIEEKNHIHNTLNRLNSCKNSIEFMIKIIKEAITRREDKQVSGIIKRAGEIFHFLTDNQHADTIKDDIIEKVIKSEIINDEINPSVLHIILLSIKFAVTNTFDDLEINLPLIIDEPFQQMDEHRISRFKQILDEISPKRQIIIFTHNNKYRDWGAFVEL